jgi:hypothetical protein
MKDSFQFEFIKPSLSSEILPGTSASFAQELEWAWEGSKTPVARSKKICYFYVCYFKIFEKKISDKCNNLSINHTIIMKLRKYHKENKSFYIQYIH